MDPSRQIDRLPSTQPNTIDPPRFDDEIDLVGLVENKRQQEQHESEIEQARLALKTFNTDHERQIRKLQLTIENNKARLENIQATGLLNEPQQRKADGVSGKLLVVLGTILGLFFGLFAALMLNFISATRERLRATALTTD